MFNAKRSKGVLGIDIGSSVVKVLELSQRGGQYGIEHFGFANLPNNVVVEKEIRDIDALAYALKDAYRSSRSKLHGAAISVAGSSVITKVIQMDAELLDHEMEAQIYSEADRYISYPIEEMNLDFEVLGVCDNDPGLVNVLIAAARTENVDSLIAMLQQAGLKPKIVGVEIYAIERASQLLLPDLPNEGKDMTVAIIDVGNEMSTMSVLSQGEIIYLHDDVFGGNQLTNLIRHHYQVNEREAERIKLHDKAPDDYIDKVLTPFKADLLRQIKRSLQFFNTSDQHRAIDAIFIAGGCAKIPGIIDEVARESKTNTLLANPFKHLSLGKTVNPSIVETFGPQSLIACGLAMRTFTDATH